MGRVQVQEEMTNGHGIGMNPMEMLGSEHGDGQVTTNIAKQVKWSGYRSA